MNSSPRNSAAHCSRADRMSVDAYACSGGGGGGGQRVGQCVRWHFTRVHTHTHTPAHRTYNKYTCVRARIHSQARTCAGRAPHRCPHAHMCECIAHARTIVRVRRGQVLAASTRGAGRSPTMQSSAAINPQITAPRFLSLGLSSENATFSHTDGAALLACTLACRSSSAIRACRSCWMTCRWGCERQESECISHVTRTTHRTPSRPRPKIHPWPSCNVTQWACCECLRAARERCTRKLSGLPPRACHLQG
jgi:hypothetical protein